MTKLLLMRSRVTTKSFLRVLERSQKGIHPPCNTRVVAHLTWGVPASW